MRRVNEPEVILGKLQSSRSAQMSLTTQMTHRATRMLNCFSDACWRLGRLRFFFAMSWLLSRGWSRDMRDLSSALRKWESASSVTSGPPVSLQTRLKPILPRHAELAELSSLKTRLVQELHIRQLPEIFRFPRAVFPRLRC